jgi:hypothetical protein
VSMLLTNYDRRPPVSEDEKVPDEAATVPCRVTKHMLDRT